MIEWELEPRSPYFSSSWCLMLPPKLQLSHLPKERKRTFVSNTVMRNTSCKIQELSRMNFYYVLELFRNCCFTVIYLSGMFACWEHFTWDWQALQLIATSIWSLCTTTIGKLRARIEMGVSMVPCDWTFILELVFISHISLPSHCHSHCVSAPLYLCNGEYSIRLLASCWP